MSAVSPRHHRPGDSERHASPGAAAAGPGHQQVAVTGQLHLEDVAARWCCGLLMMSPVTGSAGPAEEQLWSPVQDEGPAEHQVR